MLALQVYLDDDQCRAPEIFLIEAKDAALARQIATKMLLENPRRERATVFEGHRKLFQLGSAEASMGRETGTEDGEPVAAGQNALPPAPAAEIATP